jgi:hypothetical protein
MQNQLAPRLADDLNMDEQDTQDFESPSAFFYVRSSSHSLQVVLYLLAHHFLAVGFPNFQIEGQENEAGEYQMLLPTVVSKKNMFFSVPKKSQPRSERRL